MLPQLLLLVAFLCCVWEQDCLLIIHLFRAYCKERFRGSLCRFFPCGPNQLVSGLLPSQGDVFHLISVCPESTLPSKAPQNFKACFSAALLSKHVLQQCHLLTPENILSSGHTLISKAIYGAIIWANTVPVTENPLMMMNSSYWWLQPDPQCWVGGKTLALKLCEFLSVSRSEFTGAKGKLKIIKNKCKKKN